MEHSVDAKEALRQFREKQTYHYLGGQKDQVAVLKKKYFSIFPFHGTICNFLDIIILHQFK